MLLGNSSILNISKLAMIRLIAVTLFCCTTLTSHAEPKPSPITIEADHAMLNEKKGISTYTGNVVLSQDDISFSADEIKVHSINGKLKKVVATGSPVKFKQSTRTNEQAITARANVVEFYADTKKVLLLNNASLSQGNNKFTGNRIEYDIASDTVTAGSGSKAPQRVKVTIDPKSPISGTPSQKPTNEEQDP